MTMKDANEVLVAQGPAALAALIERGECWDNESILGKRAVTERRGTDLRNPKSAKEEDMHTHLPSTSAQTQQRAVAPKPASSTAEANVNVEPTAIPSVMASPVRPTSAGRSPDAADNRTDLRGTTEDEVAQPEDNVAPAIELSRLRVFRVSAEEIEFSAADRTYSVVGHTKAADRMSMRVNITASRRDQEHQDKFDIYASGSRERFAISAAERMDLELELVAEDLNEIRMELKRDQKHRLDSAKKSNTEVQEAEPSKEEIDVAIALLKQPDLMTQLDAQFARFIVGERLNC